MYKRKHAFMFIGQGTIEILNFPLRVEWYGAGSVPIGASLLSSRSQKCCKYGLISYAPIIMHSQWYTYCDFQAVINTVPVSDALFTNSLNPALQF